LENVGWEKGSMSLTELIDLLSSSKAGSIAALLAATVSALAGIRTMSRNSDAAQLRRKQDATMKVVASRALVSWEQIQNFLHAQKMNQEIDGYLIPSSVQTVKRLEASLDEALSVGLMENIVGSSNHAMTYHSVFIQSLVHLVCRDVDSLKSPIEWTKQHYLFGLIRLLDRCLNYPGAVFPKKIENQVRNQIKPLRNEAFSYLETKSN
jgi:hypothetical protein